MHSSGTGEWAGPGSGGGGRGKESNVNHRGKKKPQRPPQTPPTPPRSGNPLDLSPDLPHIVRLHVLWTMESRWSFRSPSRVTCTASLTRPSRQGHRKPTTGSPSHAFLPTRYSSTMRSCGTCPTTHALITSLCTKRTREVGAAAAGGAGRGVAAGAGCSPSSIPLEKIRGKSQFQLFHSTPTPIHNTSIRHTPTPANSLHPWPAPRPQVAVHDECAALVGAWSVPGRCLVGDWSVS